MTDTFLGVPASKDGRVGRKRSDIAIAGAPYDWGSDYRPGARFGPRAIRRDHYIASGALYHVGAWQTPDDLVIVDTGDPEPTTGSAARALGFLEEHLQAVAPNTDVLALLGGDHGCTLPALRVLASIHGALTLVYADAHTDTWEWEHDSPNHGTIVRDALDEGLVEQVHLVGLRGYGPLAEGWEWLHDRVDSYWTMHDVEQHGIGEVAATIVEQYAHGPCYLSMDMDVLDPAYAPGVTVPEPGGLTTRELFQFARRIARSCDMVGVDVMETCPTYDHHDATSLVASRLMLEVFTAISTKRDAP